MTEAEGAGVPEPQGKFGGMPYDFRPPTTARLGSRAWNRQDPRMFTPKSFGWGYAINFYWLFHLLAYFRNRRRR